MRLDGLSPNDRVSFIVILAEQVGIEEIGGRNRDERLSNLLTALQNTSERAQANLRGILQRSKDNGDVDVYTPLWIINAVAVTGSASLVNLLANQPEVKSIVLDQTIQGPDRMSEAFSSNPPEQNLALINAPSLWNLGYQGQGIVVASMDTGVDYNHPDLAARWRGGNNSWYDPYGQHPATPTDVNGHGTWTMGVMVGGDAGGTSIGMAPQASWIAVKIFNDSNVATTSAIHLGFQWLLNPDGNPQTNDTPVVVNNSWTLGSPGCDLSFEPDLQALVVAGISPVFAAGNYGPSSSTSASPANNPSAFAVGATDNFDVIYSSSSRGPTSCGQASSVVYPAVVAPGVGVRTSDLYGLYYSATGTSLAAPHVAGAIALLLNAFPNLSVADLRNALTGSALDLGITGADNTFGYGRIDVFSAYNLIAGGATPTSTPTATSTSTPLPSPTPTPTVPPVADLIFSDGLESGNLSAWSSSVTDGGDLSVNSAAALSGSYGMLAALDDNNAIYVTDETPNAETRYRARFYFDPNSIAMASNNAHYVFFGYSGSSIQVARIELRFYKGSYQLRGALRNDGNSWTSSSWIPISDVSHFIEIDWRASTASGASNGGLTLWIDGLQRANLSGVDNDTRRIDQVQLGAIAGIDSGTRGAYFFDAFESRRQTYIGP
jgi:subtilisin family serine protease